jgi:hypothetical protein
VLTHAHGFVARDDGRGEIVVAFRGSRELADIFTGRLLDGMDFIHEVCSTRLRADGNLLLAPLVSRGIEKDNAASVHAGFLISYNSVRASVIRIVRGQLLAFPDYSVVIAGTFFFLRLFGFFYCTVLYM